MLALGLGLYIGSPCWLKNHTYKADISTDIWDDMEV